MDVLTWPSATSRCRRTGVTSSGQRLGRARRLVRTAYACDRLVSVRGVRDGEPCGFLEPVPRPWDSVFRPTETLGPLGDRTQATSHTGAHRR